MTTPERTRLNRIRILPEEVSNQIAAGEVIERPASVIKELIENSLDADASICSVTIGSDDDGTMSVMDDGIGMNREDAVLSLRRHATSKLRTARDLDGIRSLGFRGEALPSIASVSRLRLETAPRSGGEGTRIVVVGGEAEPPAPSGCPPGTTVAVSKLFFNTPARRKFMRRWTTERSHILRVITSYALANPQAAFSLEAKEKTILSLKSRQTLLARAKDCLPRRVSDRASYFERDLGVLKLRAVLGPAELARASRLGQYLFVNSRLIKDRLVSHALQQAYDPFVPKGRHPTVVLLLDLDPSRLDVNVHPTKAEVRFAESGRLHQLISQTMREAYRQSGRAAPMPLPGKRIGFTAPDLSSLVSRDADVERAVAATMPVPTTEAVTPEELLIPEGPPRILGQIRNTYIIANGSEGLLIIDQHVAHERIHFERVLHELEAMGVRRQPILIPDLLSVDDSEADLVRTHEALLQEFGFLVEPFGPREIVIREAPELLGGKRAAPVLRDILDQLGEEGRRPTALNALRHGLAAAIACKAAIKAHQALTASEQAGLIRDLFSCENHTRCPHGRPIVLAVDHARIARHFERKPAR